MTTEADPGGCGGKPRTPDAAANLNLEEAGRRPLKGSERCGPTNIFLLDFNVKKFKKPKPPVSPSFKYVYNF